jgi:LAO/AO transport system kinase
MESAGSTLPTADASDLDRVIADLRAGKVRGLARAITLVERRDPQTRDLFEALGPPAKVPLVIGLTGSPGTGKSTLADAIVAFSRGEGLSVAVLAVDPNSPYTGGAVFGDRIRMQRHALDPGVYIRSMGARGHLGGLSVASREAVRLLAAYGFDLVLLETVGVGQSELEVAGIADCTLVVLAPGLGDGVQMIKAGIMEIADIYVVNKADLPGYERTVQEIRSMLNMGPKLAWKPPIVPTIAARGEGIAELKKAIDRHQAYLASSGEGEERRRRRLEDEAADLVAEWSRVAARRLLRSDQNLRRKLDSEQAPYGAAEAILKEQGAKLVPGASGTRK